MDSFTNLNSLYTLASDEALEVVTTPVTLEEKSNTLYYDDPDPLIDEDHPRSGGSSAFCVIS